MDVVREVFIVFSAASLAGGLVRLLRLPSVTGELVAGVVLGPHVLGWVQLDPALEALASLGIVILMFTVGLEVRATELAEVGAAAGGASLAGVVLSAATVGGVALAFGAGGNEALRAAVALSASSAAVGARIVSDLGLLTRPEGRVAVGAAVVDDVLALVALGIVLGTGAAPFGPAAGAASALLFVVVVVAAGPRLARRHAPLLSRVGAERAFVLALVLCLGLALASERAGLAALVGAFLAGMTLTEARDHAALEGAMAPLATFLVPFFFFVAGGRLDPRALTGSGAALGAAVCGASLLAKMAGAAAGAFGLEARGRLVVGTAMVGRGEVTIAAAAAALASGGLGRELYAAVLATVLVTNLAAPPLARAAARSITRAP